MNKNPRQWLIAGDFYFKKTLLTDKKNMN